MTVTDVTGRGLDGVQDAPGTVTRSGVVVYVAPYAPHGPVITGTSETEVMIVDYEAIDPGERTVSFVVDQFNPGFQEGTRMRAAVTDTIDHWMEGVVTDFEFATNTLTMVMDLASGAGLWSDWQLVIAGERGQRGPEGPTGQRGAPGEPGGPPGPPGIQGAKGDPGTHIIEELDHTDDLPVSAGPGEAYLIDGHIWAWNMTTHTFENVGYIKGPQGERGDPGEPGGPPGPMGPPFTLLGSVPEPANLPATGNPGEAYLLSAEGREGDLYIWSIPGNNWQHVGNIRGSVGPPGPAGPVSSPTDEQVESALRAIGLDPSLYVFRDGSQPFTAVQHGVAPLPNAHGNELITAGWATTRYVPLDADIINVGSAVILGRNAAAPMEAVTLQQLQAATAPNYLPLVGGTLTGPITLPRVNLTGSTASWSIVGSDLRVNWTTNYWDTLDSAGIRRWISNNSTVMTLNHTGNLTIWGNGFKPGGGSWGNSSSDIRTKNIDGDYSSGLAQIEQLNPVIYRYKGNDDVNNIVPPEQQFIGLVAQDVENVMPELVIRRNGKIDGKEIADFRSMDTSPLLFALVNAVKELSLRLHKVEKSH